MLDQGQLVSPGDFTLDQQQQNYNSLMERYVTMLED